MKWKPGTVIAIYCMSALALLSTTLVHAEERILSFHSDISINEDGSMEVTETIRVRAEGRQIKRGIYRDFPTVYDKWGGAKHKVEFEVISIERDAQPEPWHGKKLKNGMRIYIGDATKYIESGTDISYSLRYRTHRQLGFFDEHDELYWNVTGNGWGFPIDEASAKVSLPAGVPLDEISFEGYTGPQGSRAQNYITLRDGVDAPVWRTNQPLQPQEGLTIVLGWPKGHIEQPGTWQRLKWMIRDNSSIVGGFVVLLLTFYLYYRAWKKVGRDPDRGVIVAQYAPPKGLSAAAVSYLVNMRFNYSGLSASIIELAVKGVHEISESGKDHYRLTRRQEHTAELNDEQMALCGTLYSGGDTIEVKKGKHRLIGRAMDAVKNVLKPAYFGSHFSRNGRSLIPGVLVSVIGLQIVGLLSTGVIPGFLGVYFPAVFLTAIWVIILASKGGTQQGKVLLVILSIFLVALSVALTTLVGFWFILLFVLASIMSAVFYKLMRAYTPAGRRLMDEIAGFKLYLSTAEQNRMNLLNPPQRTPELFEQNLPYALALGVENQWAEQFSDILSKAATDGDSYHPSWYRGQHWNVAKPAAFAGALGVGLASTISAASVAPGSRSGGGGGGYSGGGGGGGGGGGW